ncbi:hypothetical protein [Tolypothrix sp. VBCCA 56010]|uniref:hypothetical protein n=1 Tax=Tolypothrix sp. VBCCA 56010 TaxID=3137731 RepID=UPI003D7C7CE4
MSGLPFGFASRSWGKPRQMLQVGEAAQRTASPRPRWLTAHIFGFKGFSPYYL